MHDQNAFLTLTYAPEHLPKNGSLDKTHFQKFMKRLRFNTGAKIRYFHCGEYGEKLSRPHYHALIFGYGFDDKYQWSKSQKTGEPLFRSNVLEAAWKHGHASIGTVTEESAGYVSRYILKKVVGDPAEAHYEGKQPEYISGSMRPGIGRSWFERYWRDCYPKDFVTLSGKRYPVPKYYDALLERMDPDLFEEVRENRIQRAADRQQEDEKRLRQKDRAIGLRQNHFDNRKLENAM